MLIICDLIFIHRIDPNPLIRHSLWSQVIGGFVYWLQTGALSQNIIQRYLALPNLRTARRAMWIFVGGVTSLMLLCAYNGLLIYATYKNCDPLTTKVLYLVFIINHITYNNIGLGVMQIIGFYY